jgi:hypothetical protein
MPITVGGAGGANTFTGGVGDDTFVLNLAGGAQTDTITDFGTIHFGGPITGDQQAPAVMSAASGTFAGELLKGDLAFDFQVRLTGLDLGGQTATTTDDVVAAHFHLGAAATNGGIVFGFIGVPNNDANGHTVINPAAGTISGEWDAAEGNGTTLTAQLANLLAGQLYINFHTAPNPGGEIRGQVLKLDTGNDKIDLTATGITSDVNGSANIVIPGSGGAFTLVLQSVPTSALSASDFIFAAQPATDALTQDFMIIHLGRPPSTSEAAILASLNQQLSAGQITQAQAVEGVIHTADADTSVANQTYAYFTGATPTLAGLTYLTSPTGPNPNNLNSPYYAQFNLENRYINFAANLGVGGAGAAAFAAAYGPLTFGQAVAKAYDAILGDAAAAAAGVNVAAALAAVTADQPYFQYYGQTTGSTDLGTKAAMIGYLMAEGAKADIGAFAVANTAFLGHVISGDAQYNVDLVGTYAPSMAHSPLSMPPPMPMPGPYGY